MTDEKRNALESWVAYREKRGLDAGDIRRDLQQLQPTPRSILNPEPWWRRASDRVATAGVVLVSLAFRWRQTRTPKEK